MPFSYETAFVPEEMWLSILLFKRMSITIYWPFLPISDRYFGERKKIMRRRPCSLKVLIYLEILLTHEITRGGWTQGKQKW